MTDIRDRAWRLVNNKRNKHREMGDFQPKFTKEKTWKMLYTRSDKIKRAMQLGMTYPQVSRAVSRRNALDELQKP
ncbi:hypothetical protein Z042_17325 [Chania multitudinisentens RB-25]|uniref:Uncharacterized protein n=1 Tax=Chania multitudinisentens RB-25 TaxID=1441930 RepID=W0LFJ4_9GAMM|nr:hypothetical protein [Chania multitudinisentens]AHG21164.1 hypothetical protein Z042_17325 [Chania multitudinisentens RB-25]